MPRTKKRSVTIKAAFIMAFATVLASVLSLFHPLGCIKQLATDFQSKGDSKNNTISTAGDNSPITIDNRKIQHITNTTVFSNYMPSATLTNTVYKDVPELSQDQLEQIHKMEETTGLQIPIPSNRLTRLGVPQTALTLDARLSDAYNAGDLNNTIRYAQEGTNMFAGLMILYSNDLILAEGSLFMIASHAYRVLAEYSMYKKDYTTALQLIEESQRIDHGTNTLSIAIQVALNQLSGNDDQMSTLLTFVSEKLPEPTRFEVLNYLTRMGYLLPYHIKRSETKSGCEIQYYDGHAKTFGLSRQLEYAPVITINTLTTTSAPTVMRWVGLNQYEPLDLTRHCESIIKRMNMATSTNSSSVRSATSPLTSRIGRAP